MVVQDPNVGIEWIGLCLSFDLLSHRAMNFAEAIDITKYMLLGL